MTLGRRLLKRVNSPHKSPKRHNTSLRKRALIKQLSGDVQFGPASKANVKVVVRIRPHNARELESGARSVVKVVDDHMLIFDPKEEKDDFFFKGVRQRTRDLNRRQNKEQKFMFERVFDESSTNEQIYKETTEDIIDTILEGYNCSVFAYGATGAGKTFTMLGKPDNPGITFLTLMELYRRIDELKEEKTCEVGVSYLEVYNETVRDLLQPGKLLNVQESGSRVLIPGLSLHKPKDADDLLKMLAFGNQNRSQHPTDANAESSRSHAVFQIFVRQQDRTANLKSNVSIAKLSMIDLAGSERGAATGFKGARFREGANINKSLLALGNCINALADGLRHIPYRDSKLTRLLKDSLGGNCRSVMIAAISPSANTFEDTFNTLRYANRAKTIKTTLKKNLLNVDQHVSQYVKIVEDLREEICALKDKIKNYEEKEKNWEANEAALKLANEAVEKQESLEKEIANMQQQLQEKTKVEEPVQSSEYVVSDDELATQKKLEEASCERRALRRELLQLESSQRELEIKIHNSTLRLQRMKIVSFASQRLDKSISKCERTIRNFTSRLEQTKKLQQNIEVKLEANLSKLLSIQAELNQWGLDASQPSLPSKALIEKNEASLAERDLGQFAEYLKGLVKEGIAEQNSSEQLVSQLLNVVRMYYLQLRANNVCSPQMERLFEGVIDGMNESKILWADQLSSEDPSPCNELANMEQPILDVDRITTLPVISNVFISPTVPQDTNKVFRRSIMKGSKSTSCLPAITTSVLLEHESEINELIEVPECDQNSRISPRDDTVPQSPVLSTFSQSEVDYSIKPSPVIGSVHLQVKMKTPVSEVLSPSVGKSTEPCLSTSEIASLRSSCQLPLITTVAAKDNINEARVLDSGVLESVVPNVFVEPQSPVLSQSSAIHSAPKNFSFGFVSMTDPVNQATISQESCRKLSVNMNETELLEDIQPVDYSINSTFAITPAKGPAVDTPDKKTLNTTIDLSYRKTLNTTIDLSDKKTLNTTIELPNTALVIPSTCSSNLSTTKAFKTDWSGQASVKIASEDTPVHVKAMNTTIDLSDRCSSTIEGQNGKGSQVALDAKGIGSCRNLFQTGNLDATFSFENSGLGCSELDPKSPMLPTKPGDVQRSPLAPLENIGLPLKLSKDVIVPSIRISEENKMLPPSSTKKCISKKPGVKPLNKTPSKSALVKNNVGLRRSMSTSALMSGTISSNLKHSQPSPVFKRKSNVLGSALPRITSLLKSSKLKDQENMPPASQRHYTPNYKSSKKETISSMAKQGLQKT